MASALQDLIDGQISDRVGGGLSLPKGVVDIDDTLKIVSVLGFTFGGQAPLATQLRWVGPNDRPMFLLDRCQDILLEDFSISVGDEKELLAAVHRTAGRVGAEGSRLSRAREGRRIPLVGVRQDAGWRALVVRRLPGGVGLRTALLLPISRHRATESGKVLRPHGRADDRACAPAHAERPAVCERPVGEGRRTVTDQAPYVALLNPRRVEYVSARVGNYQFNPQLGPLFDQFWVR